MSEMSEEEISYQTHLLERIVSATEQTARNTLIIAIPILLSAAVVLVAGLAALASLLESSNN